MIERKSKLQIRILNTLYKQGQDISYEEVKSVSENDTSKRADLEKDGYKFTNPYLEFKSNKPSGNLRYAKSIQTKKLHRSKLLFLLFNWQEYNIYKDSTYCTGWKYDYFHRKGKPPKYESCQASLTRSLHALAGYGYIDLLSRWEDRISVYTHDFAKRLGVKAQDFKEERKQAYLKEKLKWEELKKTDKTVAGTTFAQYLDLEYMNQIMGVSTGGYTTKRRLLESWHSHRNSRNIVWVRLTEKGMNFCNKYLSVKYETPLQELTDRSTIQQRATI